MQDDRYQIKTRKEAERLLRISYQFLEIADRHHTIVPLLKEFVQGIQSCTGCEAAGIRILDEDDGGILYQECIGFSCLCEGEIESFLTGGGCLCATALRGGIAPLSPFFTDRAAFFVNDLSCRHGNGQGRRVTGGGAGCRGGYESIALIPLREGDRMLGLIQVADSRRGMFSPEAVQMLEKAALQLCIILRGIRAGEENREMQNQIRQMQWRENLDALAGGIAHDFNNLLTSIQGHAELSMANVEEEDILYHYLREIRRSALLAADLTRKLLLFNHRHPGGRSTFSLNKVLDELLVILKRVVGEDLSIELDMRPDLWLIHADRCSIEQAVMNMAVYARKALPAGGTISIRTENRTMDEIQSSRLSGAKPGWYVCLTVSYSGKRKEGEVPGGTVEQEREGAGQGFSLAVTYGIAKQHGGWMSASGLAGRGAAFMLYLPALSTEAPQGGHRNFSVQDLRGRGEKILLVEDSKGVREFARRAFNENGYMVFEASNAEEALDIFEREKGDFHLAFCDVVLPDATALSLADRLLQRKPSLKVLLSSGHMSEKSQWNAIRQRGFRFLQKPYTLFELLMSVREALRMH